MQASPTIAEINLEHRHARRLDERAVFVEAMRDDGASRRKTPAPDKADHIGRYRLVQKLGGGTAGVVYLAEQREPIRRSVALKVAKTNGNPHESAARLHAERQALALLDHPGIAKVLDAGATATGAPFFVMELVRGIAITRYCDDNRLTVAARLQLFVEVCVAVHHAHAKGIVHCDLKPANILVALHEGRPAPKIIDFGAAQLMHGRVALQPTPAGFAPATSTSPYASPEQVLGGASDVDPRSDVYSLGVVLVELLVGPRASRAADATLSTRVSEDFAALPEGDRVAVALRRGVPPSALTAELRGDLDWIVMRCLQTDPARRYESCRELASDVQRYLGHRPIIARPAAAGYRTGKFFRRHRSVCIAAVLAALVVATAAASLSMLWPKTRTAPLAPVERTVFAAARPPDPRLP